LVHEGILAKKSKKVEKNKISQFQLLFSLKNSNQNDFMFQLTEEEYENLRSQFATSNLEHGGRRYLPYVFTEQGLYMLSAVLKSQVAIDVSISIMRTFTKIREFSTHYNALARQIMELEKKHNKKFKEVFKRLDAIVEETQKTDEKIMGFIREK
jgi:hypothetical protein